MTRLKDIIGRLRGTDKAAHFGIGAAICATVTLVALLQDIDGTLAWRQLWMCSTGTATALFAALIKENVVDSECDVWDIAATMLGCVPIWAATALGIWFNILQYR